MTSGSVPGQHCRADPSDPGGTVTQQTASALPPVVDQQTWETALDDLRKREKAATRELDAIGAPVVIDHRDVVMVCSPVDSAVQPQGVLTPSIGDCVVAGGVVRRPNCRTRRSVISLAVHHSTTAGPRSFEELKAREQPSGSQPRGGLGNGIPPPDQVDLPPGAPFLSKSSNDWSKQASPGRQTSRQEQTPVTMTANPSLLTTTHPY